MKNSKIEEIQKQAKQALYDSDCATGNGQFNNRNLEYIEKNIKTEKDLEDFSKTLF